MKPYFVSLSSALRLLLVAALLVLVSDFACAEVAQLALAHVRAGRGPIFIECKTLRAQEHSVGGVNNEGITPRDPALMRAWREERDPERLAGARLLETGVLAQSDLIEMHAAADREAEALAAACEAQPKALPSIDELQSAVYS